jgi:predicted  nucleic acid-binding Zn-ribbon protein
MKYSAGNIFAKFLAVGIIVLFFLIIGVKLFGVQSNSVTLALAASIFVVNLFIVLGYASAIMRNESLLIEEDAADLAYYLGFSLTVASLALSFISDIGLDSSADAKSTLVKGSLAQFGAGLLATLIGLSAKIIINSKQSNLASNPEVLYQKFRQEIKGFEISLAAMTSSMDVTIKSACQSINSSAEHAADSMQKLAERLKVSSDTISENLTVDKISKPISAFSSELLKLHAPANNFNVEMGNLVKSVSAITGNLNSFNETLLTLKNSTLEEHKSIDDLVQSKKISNEINVLHNGLLTEQNTALAESNKQFLKLKTGSAKAGESIDTFASSSMALTERSVELEANMIRVNQSIISTIERLSQLVNSTNDLGVAVNSSSMSFSNLNGNSTATGLALQDTSRFITDANVKFREIPDSLDQTATSLNTIKSSLIRDMNDLSIPLNKSSVSVASLNQSIENLNQNIELLAKAIPKSLT